MPRNPRPSEVADRIDAAADYIEKHGWRTSPSLKGEARCAIMAVRQVTRSWRVIDAVTDALVAQVSHDYRDAISVGDWNDSQRDRRKVLRFMRRTARNVRDHKLVPVAHVTPWPEWRFV